MLIESFDVKDKVIIITGSSSGIGKDCVRNFLELGAKVCLNGRNETRLNLALNEMKEYEENVMGVVADGRKEEEVTALVEKVINRFGKIDVLINNAGGSFPVKAEQISSNGFNAVIQTNLHTVFHFSKAVLPHFKAHGKGKIINISSIAGIQPTPSEAHYGTSKAGVNHLTKTLAQEWGEFNINVNAIAPGPIMTKIAEEHLWHNQEKKQAIENQVALKRIGTTLDVFYACLYLATSASDYVTGSILTVDGGTRGMG
jgi:NAD(P)-dependent dehydrogenase (short-subunit alcohol dehydrogenase family)